MTLNSYLIVEQVADILVHLGTDVYDICAVDYDADNVVDYSAMSHTTVGDMDDEVRLELRPGGTAHVAQSKAP